MPRKNRKTKKLIYVFCEGESEQEYAKCLKKAFEDVAVIMVPPPASTNLFRETKGRYTKEPRFQSSAEVTDEIWFFFDVEDGDGEKWEERQKIIKYLRRMRKKPNIRVRLLMTSACVEYWFRLHYEMAIPPLHTGADKDGALHCLQKLVPEYAKGDPAAIARIVQEYPKAAQNGAQVLRRLEREGMPLPECRGALVNTDERDKWLHKNTHTFTTVQEAIDFLESLRR